MSQGPAYGYSDKTPEGRERIAELTAEAERVFGNHSSAGVWLHRLVPAVGRGQQRVVDVAGDSPEGLGEALAELERIRPTVTPEPLPKCLQPGGRKKRRWR